MNFIVNACMLVDVDNLQVRKSKKTTGKVLQKLRRAIGGRRLPVTVVPELNALCGDNAPKVANLLGAMIRKLSPIKNTRHWQDVDPAIQDSIIQAVLV
jgi:hypothetical protein